MPDADSRENSASPRDTPRLRGWLQALLLPAAIAAALAIYWAAVDWDQAAEASLDARNERLVANMAVGLQEQDIREGRLDRIVATREAIDAEDLSRIAKLPGLRSLTIGVFEGNQADLAALAQAKNLESLDLYEFPVDDDGAAALSRAESLRGLNLDRGVFGDEGLASLAKLPRLELLRFRSPNVTDTGIEALAASPSLKHLHVLDAKLTERSLETVAAMERLESFYADGVDLPAAAWKTFLAARPDVHVHVDDSHLPDDPNTGMGHE